MSKLRLAPNIVSRPVGDEIVVLDIRTSTYMAVGESGTVMWPLLQAGCEEADLVRVIATTYSVEEARVRDDVRAFVEELSRRNFLVEPAAP